MTTGTILRDEARGNASLGASNGAIFDAFVDKAPIMRTTINLDDALLEKARKLTGLEERTALLHEALRALIARESAQRLARLGGSEPQLRPVPRRRSTGR
jgi:Arc/MetJ family transcription regulator